jgi:hypothetical protein
MKTSNYDYIENKFSLSNLDNYRNNFNYDINEILIIIKDLIIEYYKLTFENIKIKNLNNLKFIIERGIDTIFTIFNITLLYSKNLELTQYQTQKAIYLYIEFISQINDDEKTFLQLNSRDAVIYVFKKTIYDININLFYKKNENNPSNKNINEKNNEYLHNSENNITDIYNFHILNEFIQIKFNIINFYINIYKTFFYKLIKIDYYNEKIFNTIITFINIINSINNKSNINILDNFIDNIYFENDNIYIFIDKIQKLLDRIIINNEITYNFNSPFYNNNTFRKSINDNDNNNTFRKSINENDNHNENENENDNDNDNNDFNFFIL